MDETVPKTTSILSVERGSFPQGWVLLIHLMMYENVLNVSSPRPSPISSRLHWVMLRPRDAQRGLRSLEAHGYLPLDLLSLDHLPFPLSRGVSGMSDVGYLAAG